MTSGEIPHKGTFHYYFRLWKHKPSEEIPSLLEQALKKLVGDVRKSNGRSEKTSFIIIDAHSVKNTDTAMNNGYDAGKKHQALNGILR